MALRRPPTTFSDEISAADLAANSVGASELADNAVDSDAIAANAVTTAKIADSTSTSTGITPAKIAENAVTSAKIATGAVIADGIAAGAVTGTAVAASVITDNVEIKPYIIPGKLYPAIVGKIQNGTNHSGTYGVTAQTDGKKYYYTDIKGSKPIKDPRIGSYFGSQRHKIRSIQALEQESVQNSCTVYSVDGRDWLRASNGPQNATGKWNPDNGANGTCIKVDTDATGAFLEIVGYFNDVNFMVDTDSNRADAIKLSVNGVQSEAANATVGGRTTQPSPIKSRYLDSGSLVNGGSTLSASLGTTPKLQTLKYEITSGSNEYLRVYGIDLIAHDTSNVNNVHIQAQNVVSYGKKFEVSASTHHYNPFAFAQDGTTAIAIGNAGAHGKVTGGWSGTGATYYDDTLHEATSLGLTSWVNGGNYYRPVNGGRIVKWVDSSGNVKTSVNMMPPTGTAIGNASDAATPQSHNWPATPKPKFSSTTIDHTQAELAKTFCFREFGNGGAGHYNATWPDCSTLGEQTNYSVTDDGTFVMDDGLTSMTYYQAVAGSEGGFDLSANFSLQVVFIGTGFSYMRRTTSGTVDNRQYVAQNLPYGTHVVQWDRQPSGNVTPLTIDGVELLGSTNAYAVFHQLRDIDIHQPKMPPIDEDAVIISDYMLMADHVVQADAEQSEISKGVRWCSGSREHHYNSSASFTTNTTHNNTNTEQPFGGLAGCGSDSSVIGLGTLPFFGTNGQSHVQQQTGNWLITIGGVGKTEVKLDSVIGSSNDIVVVADSEKVTLGQTTFQTTIPAGNYRFHGTAVASPIHTSSHYKPFETPFLHELIGGDRNMEQTHLVCSPDGKTWDELTRDTSYIGDVVLFAASNHNQTYNSYYGEMNEFRGGHSTAYGGEQLNMIQKKQFAIGFKTISGTNRGTTFEVLEDGEYILRRMCGSNGGDDAGTISINGVLVSHSYQHSSGGNTTVTNIAQLQLQKGDHVSTGGISTQQYPQSNNFMIIKVRK